jgi:hypothetical protein
MPWMVGIDEAGYGPNLGPLVMTSVACRIPQELTRANLWEVLRVAVRRAPDPADGRLLVEDSKLVYSTVRGLKDLEMGVLGTVLGPMAANLRSVKQCLEWIGPQALAELGEESWFQGQGCLPAVADIAELEAPARSFAQISSESLCCWGLVRSVIVCPARFNCLLDQWNSKGAVLSQALGELLTCNRTLDGPGEPVEFFIDKHGGRNTYAAMLQHSLGEGMVVAEVEGPGRSAYNVIGLDRPLRLTFQPRADAEHFCVALASMVSKYVRELLMMEFNRFWQTQVSDLRPTAGYPPAGDPGTRFVAAALIVS